MGGVLGICDNICGNVLIAIWCNHMLTVAGKDKGCLDV